MALKDFQVSCGLDGKSLGGGFSPGIPRRCTNFAFHAFSLNTDQASATEG